MVSISLIKQSDLRQLEYGQFSGRLLQAIDSREGGLGDDDKLVRHVTKYHLAHKIYQSLLEAPATKKKRSPELKEADSLRDAASVSLRASISAYRLSPKTDEQKAYSQLKELFDTVNISERDNDDVETSKINLLLTKLEKTPYEEAVQTLEIKKFVANLKEAQDAFELVFVENNRADRGQAARIKKAREELEKLYRTLTTYLVVVQDMVDDPLYPELATLINKVVNYYNNIIANRKSGKGRKTSLAQPTNPVTE